MNSSRNLILIAGQNCVGKTTTFNLLSQEAGKHGISYEQKPVSDFFHLLDNVRKDDSKGGLHHYHEWMITKKGGHSHQNKEPEVPFIVVGNEVTDGMFLDFFTFLSELPQSREVYFAEWTGGRNVNPPDEPASQIDLSFERIGNMLREGTLPTQWMERVKAVIHPVADTATRYALNENKHGFLLEELEEGKISPKKPRQVVDVFGEDDFFTIEGLFQSKGIPIYIIQNDASPLFIEQLRDVSRELFVPNSGKETLNAQSPGLSARRYF